MKKLVLASCAALAACSGLDTGNGDISRIQLALSAAPADPVDADGVTFDLQSAQAFVRHVDLYLPSGTSCAGLAGLDASDGDFTTRCDGDKIRARGPWLVDLLTGQATPALPTVPVVAGAYRRVDVRFEKGPDDWSLRATGDVPLDGASTPFRAELDFEEEARFEGDVITAGPDAVQRALLELDPSLWFLSLPLAQCGEAGDLRIEGGVLLLEDGDDDCSDLESTVRDAIKGSGSLRDDD